MAKRKKKSTGVVATLKKRVAELTARLGKRRKRKIVRKRKVTRVRKNPARTSFVIRAKTNSKRFLFYRASSKSFIDSIANATAFKTRDIAVRNAKALLNSLPISIHSLSIETV